MGHTNSTPNIGLPQFIGTDKPTWLGDINGAMSTIDTKVGSIDAAIATTDAKADNAVADASGAVTTATNAVNTAGAASTTATQANNLATQALTVANNTADLCTLQIVPDVNANKAAIGTLADLTTTAKDNLVDAINEVAQGSGVGSWQSIKGTSVGTAVNIPAGATELKVLALVGNDKTKGYLEVDPIIDLITAEAPFSMRSGADNCSAQFDFTANTITLAGAAYGGTTAPTSVMDIYYR